MSRPSTARGNAPTAAPVTTTTNADGEEQCPICKTLRYYNRSLVFLINPECYHPLCDNCVNRLFESGPNQCPYVGCHKTLRKKGFREPTFSDLTVEREVDIRKRVAAVFNKVEDEFEDLRAYNDYLDMVESLTMDLVYGAEREREAANQKLLAWEDDNRTDIERNRKQGERQREQNRRAQVAEQKAAAQRRLDAQKAEDEERAEKARQREEDLNMLAAAPTGKVMLKKRGQERQQALAESQAAAMRRAAVAASGGLSIKGLKKKGTQPTITEEDRGPYDPFGKLDMRPSRYQVKSSYRNEFLDGLRLKNAQAATGGYNVAEYYSRALFEAFAGLAVFVEDEKETGTVGMDFREVATIEASLAANEAKSRKVSAGIKRNIDGVPSPAVMDESGDVVMKDASQAEQPAVKMELDSS